MKKMTIYSNMLCASTKIAYAAKYVAPRSDHKLVVKILRDHVYEKVDEIMLPQQQHNHDQDTLILYLSDQQ